MRELSLSGTLWQLFKVVSCWDQSSMKDDLEYAVERQKTQKCLTGMKTLRRLESKAGHYGERIN